MTTKPLTVAELADLLGLSTAWIYRECRGRRLPHTSIARQIRFTEEQVSQILAAGEVAPVVAPTIPIRLRRIA